MAKKSNGLLSKISIFGESFGSTEGKLIVHSPEKELTRADMLDSVASLLSVCERNRGRMDQYIAGRSSAVKKAAARVHKKYSARLDYLLSCDLNTLETDKLHDLMFELTDIYSEINAVLEMK